MDPRSSRQQWAWQVLCFFSLWGWGSGQMRYSVVEESEPGTFVGNVALDLGLDVAAISERRLRLGSESSKHFLRVNLENGDLLVSGRIDRESLCGSSSHCVLPVEVVIENPLQLFTLEAEILDVNDNSPSFLNSDRVLRITELLATPGARFPLESAQDPDVGTNTVTSYKLDPNQHFSLSVKTRKDGRLLPELVLEKSLDREEQVEHHLLLFALDGGTPTRSGISRITVIVLDFNDNAPLFHQSMYKTTLQENSFVNTLVIKLNATDMDEGPNAEIVYSYQDDTLESITNLFSLDPLTGEIRVKEMVDFEQSSFYELSVIAKDKGSPEMEGHCVIHVEIEDVNDNAPEIIITSMVNSIPENAPLGTTVGLLNVRDLDSGNNGEVHLEISPNLPFKIKHIGSRVSLITDAILDRETASRYSMELVATDLGKPPLRTQKTIVLHISDINDNSPHVSHPVFNSYIKENNDPGSLLCTVTASDPDEGENSNLTYSIKDPSASTFVYINSHNGNVYAHISLDYESVQVLQILVTVEDAGSPKLSTSATVFVFILDQNDNPPSIVYPVTSRELPAQQTIPQTVPVGYLVTKVTAVDRDSGYNAWLSYNLLQATDPSLFRVAPYSGEIRILRTFKDTDNPQQELLILVKDHGDPALSVTVAILVSFEDSVFDQSLTSSDVLARSKDTPGLTLYLIISLVAISILSLVIFIILSAQCIKKGKRANSSRCCCPTHSNSRTFSQHFQPTFQMNADGTLQYMEVMKVKDSRNQNYRTYFSPDSEKNHLTLLKPLDFSQLRDMVNESDNQLCPSSGCAESNQVRYFWGGG